MKRTTEIELHEAILPERTLTEVGYEATRTDDALILHRVPIFVECQRGEVNFDAAWIGAAVSKAMKRQSGGYMPPLHVRHHNDGDAPEAAGFFKITGTKVITFEGEQRVAVLADLIITDPATRYEVMQKRLPYRSVEIFNVEKPGFDSLALLDHEAPFLELPMGFVSKLNEDLNALGHSPGDANATFRMDGSVNGEPVVAFRADGTAASFLFRDEPMTTKTKTPEELAAEAAAATAATVAAAKFEADGPPPKEGDDDEGKDADLEAASVDVSAIVKAITSGEIPVKAMKEIVAAIQAQETEGEEAPAEDAQPVTPTPPPGAEAMKQNTANAQIVSMQAVIDGMQAERAVEKADAARKNDVDAAFERLKDRPLGANLRTKLDKYHADFGAGAFAAHVETLATTFGPTAAPGGEVVDFRAGSEGDTEAVMAFSAKGDEAVSQARKFSRVWHELKRHGACRQSEARYIEVNMAASTLFTVAR